jgi:hypothetical protein
MNIASICKDTKLNKELLIPSKTSIVSSLDHVKLAMRKFVYADMDGCVCLFWVWFGFVLFSFPSISLNANLSDLCLSYFPSLLFSIAHEAQA